MFNVLQQKGNGHYGGWPPRYTYPVEVNKLIKVNRLQSAADGGEDKLAQTRADPPEIGARPFAS